MRHRFGSYVIVYPRFAQRDNLEIGFWYESEISNPKSRRPLRSLRFIFLSENRI